MKGRNPLILIEVIFIFSEEEVNVIEARAILNCYLKQRDTIEAEYKGKLDSLDKTIEEKEKILTECIHKLPEENVFNK